MCSSNPGYLHTFATSAKLCVSHSPATYIILRPERLFHFQAHLRCQRVKIEGQTSIMTACRSAIRPNVLNTTAIKWVDDMRGYGSLAARCVLYSFLRVRRQGRTADRLIRQRREELKRTFIDSEHLRPGHVESEFATPRYSHQPIHIIEVNKTIIHHTVTSCSTCFTDDDVHLAARQGCFPLPLTRPFRICKQ